MLGIMADLATVLVKHGDRALPESQGGSHRITDALPVPFRGLELVHHEFDEMRFVAVHGLDSGERDDLSVHPDISVASLAELLEKFAVVALAATDKRGQQETLPAGIFTDDEADDLVVRVPHHLFSRDR